LPYLEKGYFPADKASATAFAFDLKRGQKISVLITKKTESFIIYADLMLNGETVAPADSTTISYEVKASGNYVLRLQPELLRGGEYTLTINVGPALHFPVSATGHPKIGGFWGEGTDENARKHEGIDIFATKGTPAIAAEKGLPMLGKTRSAAWLYLCSLKAVIITCTTPILVRSWFITVSRLTPGIRSDLSAIPATQKIRRRTCILGFIQAGVR
jgi:hypothetical protein